MKENQPKNDGTIQLKFALTGRIKRGKGRPKGSKNKVKIIKIDYRDVKADSSEALPFGKRGKGRPKGSKNKVKQLHSLQD